MFKRFLVFLTLNSIFLTLNSSPVFAEDLLPYFNPSASCTNSISNGEQFTNKPSGSGFIIQKSADPAYYERFGYDSQNIYHYEDTTWATGNNENVKCNGTNDDATLVLFKGNFGSAGNVAGETTSHTADLGMIWVKRNMSLGECFTSEATAVGKNKRTGQYCDTPYTGPGAGHTLCLNALGPICLSTSYVMKNGLALEVRSGAGTGEQYYYDKKSGWVGFGDNLATSSSCGGGRETVDKCTTVTSNPNRSSTTGSGGTAGRCQGTNEGPFRPNAYSVCKVSAVPEAVTGTVDSFSVTATVNMHVDKILDSPMCENKYFPIINWYTKVMETYSKTKLPMAGWGNSPSLTEINGTIARPESAYLADYLEGTANYAGGNRATFTEMQTKAGVYRKLAPSWIEDRQKCDMIKAAQSGKQEDYVVKLNLLSGDLNFLQNIFKIPFNALTALLNQNSQNLKDFECVTDLEFKLSDLTNLKLLKSKLLWEAVPMFTREDTPGKVTLSPQNPPGKLTDVPGGDGTGTGSVTYPLSIPHVARLNAISQTTNNMMLPSSLQNTTALADAPSSTPLIAAPADPPPGNLLAEADYCQTSPFTVTIDNISYHDGQVFYSVELDDPNTDGPQCHLYINDQFNGGCIQDKEKGNPTRFDAGSTSGLINPVPSNGNGDVNLNVSFKLDQHKPCGFTSVIGNSCKVSLKNGVVDTTKTTCGALAISPTPTPCGNLGPFNKPSTTNAVADPKDPKYLDSIRKKDISQNLTNKDATPNGGIPVMEAEQTKERCEACKDRVRDYNDKNPTKKPKDPEEVCQATCSMDVNYTTGVSTTITLPYLKSIWRQEARDKKSGLFNFLTPGGASGSFTKTDSKTKIGYGLEGDTMYYTGDPSAAKKVDAVSINPPEGSVVFPYLQGIYDAQTCVSQSLLLPAQFARTTSCPRLY